MFTLLKGYGGFITVTFVFFIGITACKQEPSPPENMVAQVNDSYLLKQQLDYSIPADLDKDVALALRKDIISKWVENDVLYQAALAEGFKLSPKYAFFVDEYRKALLVQEYVDQKLNKNYKISVKEINSYYQEHQNEFIRSEDEVRVVHLWMEQRDNAIFREIRKSDELLSIIKKYFFDQKSSRERPNGDLGYLPITYFPQAMRRIIKRMKVGAISRPLQTEQGYHFFQLLDRQKKGSLRELELVKNKIVIRLKQIRIMEARAQLVKQAKSDAQIQTYLSKIQN